MAASAAQTAPLGPDDVQVGDWVDVRDTSGAWCGCRVLAKSTEKVLVQPPLRWNMRTELWLDWSSARLASFRCHSHSAEGLDRQPTSWEQTIAECHKCAAQLAVLEAALPDAGISPEPPWTPARLASLLCGDVPDLVNRLLGQEYGGASAAVGARVLEANRFFLQFLRFFCIWLRAAPELLRTPPRHSLISPCGPLAICAAALSDLVATFGRIFGTMDRRAVIFFETHAALPERHGCEALWPGGEAGWLHAAVAKATGHAAGVATKAAMPLAWLLIKLRGMDEASARADGVDVAVLEEAMRRLSLLHCNIAVFCAMGGVEGILNALRVGSGDEASQGTASNKHFRIRPLPFEGVRTLLLPLATTVAVRDVAPTWIELTLPGLLAAIRGRIIGMWDDEVRGVDRELLLRCLAEPAVNLLVAKCSRSELEELREELLLLFCRRRLQSPFLEKRLKALSDVKEVVDRVSPRATMGWSVQSLWGSSGRDRDSRKSAASSIEATANSSGSVPLLSPAGLARWIADDKRYGLLPILFGARAHPEVLRRANFLLRLLAQEQLLTRDCLNALWLCGCSADKHEGLTYCVLDLFVEIASSLDHSQIKFVVGKVVDMSPHSIDEKFVRFLRDFLLASVNTRRHTQATEGAASNGDSGENPLGEGLAVFWQLLRTEAAGDAPLPSVSAVIAKQARACFLDLLRNPHFASHRNRHLQSCWKALHEGPADTSLVHLFRELLETFPAGGGRIESTSNDIGPHVQRDVVLLRLSSEEGQRQLSGFLLNCTIRALEAESGSSGDVEPGTPPGGNLDLVAAILDTLLYSLTESPLQIGLKDMESLWQSVSGVGPQQLNLVAAWLSRVAAFTFASKVFNRPHWEVWPESEYVHFFQKVLRSSSQTDFKCLSHDGLVCFVNYMKLCNLKLFSSTLQADMLYIPETPNCSGVGTGAGYPGGGAHSYTPGYSQLLGRDGVPRSADLATAVGKRFRVVRWGLIGNEELWEIVMLVADPVVFGSCSDFLVSCVVFLHPCSDLYRQRVDVHLVFLQRCMRILESPGEGAQGSARAHKVLALLAKFVHFARLSASRNQTSAIWPVPTELERTTRDRKSKQDVAASFHIMFRSDSSSDVMQQKTVYVPRSTTLGCLRSRVAAAFQITPRELGLYTYPSMQLLDWDLDCLTLDECQVSSSLYAAHARPVKQDQDSEQSVPLWQMSEKDLDTFLDLLAEGAISSGFNAPVWAILGCFPVPQPIVGVLTRVARWGLDAAGQGGRRPLAELLGDGRQRGHLEVQVPLPGGVTSASSLAAEFNKFWHAKVWSWSSGVTGEHHLHTHRLLYTLRVIHSLMLGDEMPSARARTGERLLLHSRREGGTLTGDAWSRGFLQAGGLELLLSVFAELHGVRDVHTLHCLSLLAHSIRELVEKLPDVSEAARSQQPGVNAAGGSMSSQPLDMAIHALLPPLVPLLLESVLLVVRQEYGTMEVKATEGEAAEAASACYSAQVLKLCSSHAVDEVHGSTSGTGSAQLAASDASVCVSRIFSLLHVILRREPDCSMALQGFHGIAELLRNGILGLDSAVREATASGVLALCISDPSEDGELSGVLLTKLLFEVLPGWQEQPERSDQLFALIARLLQRHRSPQPAAMGLVPQPQPPAPRLDEMGQLGSKPPISELLDSLVMQLRTGAASGGQPLPGAAEDQTDTLLLGMLQLLHSILHCFPHLKGPASQALASQLLRCCLGPAAVSLPQVQGAEGCDEVDCMSAPRCRTSQSRLSTFALLHELATDSAEACLRVARLLLATCTSSSTSHKGQWRESDWVIHPDTGVKSATGFVGLKNLGATCYMNSVLQQLFAHREFQQGILQVHEEVPEKKTGAGAELEKTVFTTALRAKSTSVELLYQMQVLFSSLRTSQRQYYTPQGFCAAFRDWEGRPVNVMQQMDADEFLSLLMDQLERGMAGLSPSAGAGSGAGDTGPAEGTAATAPMSNGTTSLKGKRNLLRKLFGGTLCTEIIPKASGAGRSERHEDFVVLSLEVKGKPSLCASLEAFVEGEMLEGDNAYYSEEQGCKVDALKRTCLQTLPETLIIVLKRFEFDFDTMQKVKLNDLCEFPMRLDMWPYMKEALDGGAAVEGGGSKHEYVLRGIVLHSGTADSGHYSSLVKGEHSQWYEFNDTLVTPVCEDDIPQEAFGGTHHDDFAAGGGGSIGSAGSIVGSGGAAGSRGGTLTSGVGSAAMAPSRSKNAYLLFYDRASLGEATAEDTTHADVQRKAAGEGSSQENGEASGESIQQSVEAANRHHWHAQAVFSVEFGDFAWMFVANFYSSPVLLSGEVAEAPQADSVGALKYMQLSQLRRETSGQGQLSKLPLIVCNFAATFLFTILIRSRDRQALPEWCSLICRLLQRAGLAAQRWFAGLLASHGFLRETFLECPVQETRIALLAVVVQVLHWVYKDEAATLRAFTANSPEGTLRHGQQWSERPTPPEEQTAEPGQPPLLATIWATLIELLPVARQPEAQTRFAQYFELIQEFLHLGPETLAWALKAGSSKVLIAFVLQESNGAAALEAATASGLRWYQPNWLRTAPHSAPGDDANRGDAELIRPVSRETFFATGDKDQILLLNAYSGDASSVSTGVAESADSSFERHLHSNSSNETLELGTLWGALFILLEQSSLRAECFSEENEMLLRRLVRFGGITSASAGPASRLLQLFCKGDLGRSQGVVCRICERIEESDGRALRGALRMGSALVAITDAATQQRSVFLLKSVLHVAKNNRKYFRTMHFVIHYIVRWCRRRPELPQWLLSEAGHQGSQQYRWLESWLKDNISYGRDSWQHWQANPGAGNTSINPFRRDVGEGLQSGGHGGGYQDSSGSARYSWCSEMLPYVRKIARGEPLTREAVAGTADSDFEEVGPSGRNRVAGAALVLGVPRMQLPVLSKVQMVNKFAAADQRQQQQQDMKGIVGMAGAW